MNGSTPGCIRGAWASHALLASALLCGVAAAQVPGTPLAFRGGSTRAALPTENSGELPDAPVPQAAAAPSNPGQADTQIKPLEFRQTPRRMVSDEWQIVTSPARIRTHDLRWLLPLAAASAAALATDTKTMRDVISHNPDVNSAADTASGALRDVFIAAPIAMFGIGKLQHNTYRADAGLLGGEAMINALATDEGIKYIALRERPYMDNARGHFFAGDSASDPSFISGHAMVTWSSAAVLAETYSRPWQQVTLYTLASGVSFSRVIADRHFPSDVLLGSACGWLIGHYIYGRHMRPGERHMGNAARLLHPRRGADVDSLQAVDDEEKVPELRAP